MRTQPKHEHIAASHIRSALEFDAFAPKLRIRRATRRGAVWFNEPLFPGYIFARFCWHDHSLNVRGVRGVSTVVTFGANVPSIPDAAIEALRSQFDAKECHEVPETIQNGDVVTIGCGPFHGLEATVLRVMSPNRRIQVLLEMMGGPQPLEMSLDHVTLSTDGSAPPPELTPFLKEKPLKDRR